ncbi:MAG: TM2 domain-containing membrane protein YozV [Planctomycetota bacterium]|jgi:TM2 domain-containing membrane protein YozV
MKKLAGDSLPDKDPNIATLLTWLIPGAGHLYLGNVTFAILAFLVVDGIFLLGFTLSGGATVEFLDPELRGRFALVLTPEAGNLGALLWTVNETGFPNLSTDPRAWPTWVMEGGLLTALAGILNIIVMVRANLDARTSKAQRATATSPAVLCGLAWLVPGLGHFFQGRRLRGLVVFILLVGAFVVGTYLAEGTNLSRERHFYYWSGQFFLGAPALLTEVLSGRPPVTGSMPFADVGLTFGCIAGLLNVLAMLDVYRYSEAKIMGESDDDPGAVKRPSVAEIN